MANLYNASGLQCLSCGGSNWKASMEAIICLSCQTAYAVNDGVVQMQTMNDGDDVTQFYAATNGTDFVDASFESNTLIYITTRGYRQFLDKVFQEPKSSLMDFGCGDGRFSLWAAEKGFPLVVAVDSNLGSLKRLASEAIRRGLKRLVIVCADLRKPPFQADSFDAVLCIEVLYYLAGSLDRQTAIQTPSRLLNKGGKMVIGEFSRMGRAIIDLDAMNLANVRSLLTSSTRWEKAGSTQTEVFQWSLAELKSDLREAGLHIVDQSGISIAAALFSYAWNFTSYPLRPLLNADVQAILETISDQTSDAVDAARNVMFAVEKLTK
ncbi:MAG TPA: class I SAM-dependent methyltransferase [Alloacidobacterium sp.]|nr:class I SAM-dependent methyltransferase [Alloacidobacterium sp.]